MMMLTMMMHHTTRNCQLLLLASIWRVLLADIFEECTANNNNNFVASNKSCTHYIFCNGEDSFEGECPEQNDYFNAQLAMCEPMQDLDCRTGLPLQAIDADPQQSTLVTELETSTTPTVVESTTIASTAIATTTAVVTEAATVASSSQNATTTTSSSQVVTIVATSCPATDDHRQIVLLAYDKSCTEYFICYHGKPLPMTCAAMLHFNVKTGKCDKAEIVNCLRSTISVREQCKSHTVDIYPHPDNCNYFYYCRQGFLMLQQCPIFYGWDYEKRSCVAIRQAKCFGRTRL